MTNPREDTGAFGAELRRRRVAADISLGALARKTHYTKGYLSRVETGKQRPSEYLARRCDALLGADGALSALVAPAETAATADEPVVETVEDLWLLGMGADGESAFRAVGRREVLAFGAASLAGLRLGGGSSVAGHGAPAGRHMGRAVHEFRVLFDHTRRVGQSTSPSLVLPLAVAQAHALRALMPEAGGADRTRLGVLAARNAEYAGWMAQESGDDRAALWWTRKAVDLAAEVGDDGLAAYALVRHALVTMYQGDARSTVDLARRAQEQRGLPPRVLGLAAQREGQGHALAGDRDRCMRALDRARELLRQASDDPGDGPVLGTSTIAEPVGVVSGWCLYDLGRPEEAAAVLDVEVARIPRDALRARARFGVRQALAHAAAGEVEHACELTTDLLDVVGAVDSHTVAADLRTLAGTLRRWHTHRMVRDLDPALNDLLRRA
ncbi:helix-turn-helix domain-containing protein [Actinosynnema sp. NPDC059797]